jgi:Respiratory-chain NADH dehydrogenase, 30 Kd subunit.
MALDTIKSSVEELLPLITKQYDNECRLVTATCTDEGEEFRIIYTFDDSLQLINIEITVPKGVTVPSITGTYLCAFLVENEMKELFGIPIENIAIDLGGRMYMTDGMKSNPMARHAKELMKEEG